MYRIQQRFVTRSDGAAVAVAVMIIAGVLSGSCLFGSTTTLCEASGRRCPQGQTCARYQDACIPIGGCGDGVIDPGEVCDDGNIIDGDGCSATCTSNETCGNAIKDDITDEGCDDGNTVDGDGCNATCKTEVCGNGVREGREVCDDGNRTSGDGCNTECTSNEVCGNGIVDDGETCDPENRFPRPARDTTDCDSDCTRAECGDGHVNKMFRPDGRNESEECDDAGDSAGCDRDCTYAKCGDHYVNSMAKEECDDGDDNDDGEPDACRENCRLPSCGDGVMDSGETCDDGNKDNRDDCPDGPDGTCRPAFCGDGFRKATGPNQEKCDGADGCTPLQRCAADCSVCQSLASTEPSGPLVR